MQKGEIQVHFRKYEFNGEFFEKTSRGGSTFYAKQLDPNDQNSWVIGIARCSDHDNFCRKTGRELAQEKAKKSKEKVSREEVLIRMFTEYVIMDDLRSPEFFRSVMEKA